MPLASFRHISLGFVPTGKAPCKRLSTAATTKPSARRTDLVAMIIIDCARSVACGSGSGFGGRRRRAHGASLPAHVPTNRPQPANGTTISGQRAAAKLKMVRFRICRRTVPARRLGVGNEISRTEIQHPTRNALSATSCLWDQWTGYIPCLSSQRVHRFIPALEYACLVEV